MASPPWITLPCPCCPESEGSGSGSGSGSGFPGTPGIICVFGSAISVPATLIATYTAASGAYACKLGLSMTLTYRPASGLFLVGGWYGCVASPACEATGGPACDNTSLLLMCNIGDDTQLRWAVGRGTGPGCPNPDNTFTVLSSGPFTVSPFLMTITQAPVMTTDCGSPLVLSGWTITVVE